MSKTITTIETTPEELVSKIATVVEKQIDNLNSTNKKPEKPVQVPEVAAFLDRSQNWVRNNAALGKLPSHRPPGEKSNYYFFLTDIVTWIKDGRIVSTEEILQKAEEYANSKTFIS